MYWSLSIRFAKLMKIFLNCLISASSSASFLSYCNIIIRWVGGYSKKYFHKMRPQFTSVRRLLKVGALFAQIKKAASKRFQLRCAMNGWFSADAALS